MLLKVHAPNADPEILKGKYSESFIAELARQITKEIERTMAVSGVDGSTLELQLVFAPGTYMEHTSENVTYRRLLLTDKLCQPRDFWVKWTRLDGKSAYTVNDDVTEADVSFEIGEDVPQRIREREYRFLCGANPSRYQAAISKKTATEWRELIKRAVRKGELVKLEMPSSVSPAPSAGEPVAAEPARATEIPDTAVNCEINATLESIFKAYGIEKDSPAANDVAEKESNTVIDLMELARAALANEALNAKSEEPVTESVEKDEPPFEVEEAAEEADEPPFEVEEVADEADEPPFEVEEAIDEADEPPFEVEEAAEEADEPPFEVEEATDEADEPISDTVEEREQPHDMEKLLEERIYAEFEAKIKLDFEEKARIKAEEEAAALRREIERLTEAAKIAEAAAAEAEERHRRETAELLRMTAEKSAEDARERERLEALARNAEREREEALLRIEKEASEREKMAQVAHAAEEERARHEREKIAIEEQHRAEAEELRRRLEAQSQREAIERDRLAEAARIAVEEQRRRELEAQRTPSPAPAPAPTPMPKSEPAPIPKLTPDAKTEVKHAVLIFRGATDPAIRSEIKRIVEETLLKLGKQDLPIHIKAYPLSERSIALDFIDMPETERDTLVAIMKALGGGHLGISKITVE